MPRLIVPLLLLFALAASGCVAKPPEPPLPPSTGCEDAAPLHVVIGIAGHNLAPGPRRTALRAVLDQLAARVRPGDPGLVLSVYPLTDRSVAAQPLRLRLPCLPTPPEAPDLKQAPAFERARMLEAYQKAAAQSRREVQQARHDLDSFGQQLLALEPTATSTDIWGFLALAADEFATIDSGERHVIVVARDEDGEASYCDGCHALDGASVHFLAFDQPTPADQQRRRAEWSAWLKVAGAGGATFTRSNEPVPVLFGPRAAAAPPALHDQEGSHA